MSSGPYIPDRFRRAVTLHVVKNLMQQQTVRPPLVLGIHGPSGVGKTFQCECVLEELGAVAFLLSGGQMESREAGEPAQLIRSTYINASRAIEQKRARAAAVVINDIDTGVGSWGDLYQYTVNRQNVFGELMHLVDYPTSVEGVTTKRIPIIVTGNDFTKLYEPLVRAGRMTAFAYEPTAEERDQIVAQVFPELSSRQAKDLAREFVKEPVSFFTALRSSLIDDDLYREIQRVGARQVLAYLGDGMEPRVHLTLTYDRVLQFGKQLLQAGTFVNHLDGRRDRR